jgi:hypothetical protein
MKREAASNGASIKNRYKSMLPPFPPFFLIIEREREKIGK